MPNWKTIVAATILFLFWGPIFAAALYWIGWKFFVVEILINGWPRLVFVIVVSLVILVIYWSHYWIFEGRKKDEV
jgi:hypothetical protein